MYQLTFRHDLPRPRSRWVCGAAAGALLTGMLAFTPSPASAATACWDDVRTDVDGGGPDAVVGMPYYDLPGKPDAGAIVVFSNVGTKGDANPKPPTARTVLTLSLIHI